MIEKVATFKAIKENEAIRQMQINFVDREYNFKTIYGNRDIWKVAGDIIQEYLLENYPIIEKNLRWDYSIIPVWKEKLINGNEKLGGYIKIRIYDLEEAL
jgi:hypothetical protein